MDAKRLLEALEVIVGQTANWQAGLDAHPSGLLGSIHAVATSAIVDFTLGKTEAESSDSKSPRRSKG